MPLGWPINVLPEPISNKCYLGITYRYCASDNAVPRQHKGHTCISTLLCYHRCQKKGRTIGCLLKLGYGIMAAGVFYNSLTITGQLYLCPPLQLAPMILYFIFQTYLLQMRISKRRNELSGYLTWLISLCRVSIYTHFHSYAQVEDFRTSGSGRHCHGTMKYAWSSAQ